MSLFKRGNRPVKRRPQVGDDVETPEPSLFGDEPVDDISDDEPKKQNGCAFPAKEKKQRGPLILNRRAVILWSSALAFIMVWVFVLGILVGRGTIFRSGPFQELENRLAESGNGPVPTVVEARPPVPEPDPTADDAPAKLTFYDSLSKSKPSPPPPQVKAPAPPPKPTVVETPQKFQPAPAPKEPVVDVKPKASSPEPKPSPTASPETPPKEPVVTSGVKTVEAEKSKAPPPQRKAGENYTIQIAAAKTVEEADKIVSKLQAKGLDAYHYEVELEGRKYFRIRVGRYQTKEEAIQVHDRLTAQGYKNMFISHLVD